MTEPRRSPRAIEIMEACPAGCIVFPVPDAYSSPHLRVGEFAIVDTKDRQPEDGELYVIEWQNGCRQIVCARSRPSRWADRSLSDTAWMVGDLRQPGMRTSDGPYIEAHLASKLIGRIVGVLPMVPANERVCEERPPRVIIGKTTA